MHINYSCPFMTNNSIIDVTGTPDATHIKVHNYSTLRLILAKCCLMVGWWWWGGNNKNNDKGRWGIEIGLQWCTDICFHTDVNDKWPGWCCTYFTGFLAPQVGNCTSYAASSSRHKFEYSYIDSYKNGIWFLKCVLSMWWRRWVETYRICTSEHAASHKQEITQCDTACHLFLLDLVVSQMEGTFNRSMLMWIVSTWDWERSIQ